MTSEARGTAASALFCLKKLALGKPVAIPKSLLDFEC